MKKHMSLLLAGALLVQGSGLSAMDSAQSGLKNFLRDFKHLAHDLEKSPNTFQAKKDVLNKYRPQVGTAVVAAIILAIGAYFGVRAMMNRGKKLTLSQVVKNYKIDMTNPAAQLLLNAVDKGNDAELMKLLSNMRAGNTSVDNYSLGLLDAAADLAEAKNNPGAYEVIARIMRKKATGTDFNITPDIKNALREKFNVELMRVKLSDEDTPWESDVY